uniref:Uncharacterized protein n=1 Tax=Anguilla anguilla TaxID=7936 RepID=A0A0E9UCY0_ANGAN
MCKLKRKLYLPFYCFLCCELMNNTLLFIWLAQPGFLSVCG